MSKAVGKLSGFDTFPAFFWDLAVKLRFSCNILIKKDKTGLPDLDAPQPLWQVFVSFRSIRGVSGEEPTFIFTL